MSGEKVNEDDLFAIEDGNFYEVSLVPAGSQTGDKGFIIQKIDESDKQDGDESVTKEEENTVKVEDLSDEGKKELFNKLKGEFDLDKQVEFFLDGEEIAEKLKEKLDIDKEDKEEEETEKSMTPKSREALKTVLGTLSKVKDEMPDNYRWVYKAIAKLVDETAPEFEKSADKNFEISDEVRKAINKSLEQFDKADELSDSEEMIKQALEGFNVEKEEEETQEVSKEAQEQIEKYEHKVEKLREERNELEQEKIKKELTDKANKLENIPESTEKLTELFAELYNLDEDVFKKVENLVKKIDKQSEVGELFAEKGTSQRDLEKDKNESAQDKIDRLVKEKVEKKDKDKSKAMTEVLEDNPNLYEKLREG